MAKNDPKTTQNDIFIKNKISQKIGLKKLRKGSVLRNFIFCLQKPAQRFVYNDTMICNISPICPMMFSTVFLCCPYLLYSLHQRRLIQHIFHTFILFATFVYTEANVNIYYEHNFEQTVFNFFHVFRPN